METLKKQMIIMKLILKKYSTLPIYLIICILVIILPFVFVAKTNLIEKERFFWLLYFEFVFIIAILHLWKKLYDEFIFAQIKEDVLYYKRLFFLKKTIKIEDIKGYMIGSENSNFFILIGKDNKKIFTIRQDYYENTYEFIQFLGIKDLGLYPSLFDKILLLFRKKR